MNKEIINVTNLSVGHKNNILLKGMGFSFGSSNTIALMGVNGCGKTTLLKTICGLLPPMSGNIFLNGHDVSKLDINLKAKMISVVLTDRPDLSFLSVLDILKMSRYAYKETARESLDKVIEYSDLLKISQLLKLEFSTLSDGQKQIVLLCRALVQDTNIIVLDEPFTFLDIPKKLEVINLFIKIVEKTNKTLLFSTHDLEIVHNLNLDTLLVENKNTVHFDNIKTLIDNGQIENIFGHPDFVIDKESGRFLHKY